MKNMKYVIYFCIFSFLVFTPIVNTREGVLKRNVKFYTNKWKICATGGREKVEEIAHKEGFQIEGQIEGLDGIYILNHPKHPISGSYANEKLTQKLLDYNEIKWAEQSAALTHNTRNLVRVRRHLTCPRENNANAVSNYANYFNDPQFPDQWTLHDCRDNNDKAQYDINVMRVWYQYKYFGKGVIIIIIDDGIETNHADLKENYNPEFGLDLIDKDRTPDPLHYYRTFYHGTRCAGQIAMVANNTVCGVGIAPAATIGAVRLLGPQRATDETDGQALAFRYMDISITSNSWGPNDDGKTMAHLGKVTEAALKTAVTKGRNKKGVIYVFAAGNGKKEMDNCSCDPFVSSVYTIPVASADMVGRVTSYSETCSSIFVTAYSGDGTSSYNVATTDVRNECTLSHTGTSASAPQVAAAIGLALEANPNLTWRDVQHLLTYSSEVAPLQSNRGTWVRNSRGLYYSLDFGFGMLDVYKLVTLAKTFKQVPPLSMCVVKLPPHLQNKSISRLKSYRATFEINGCKNLPSEVNYLEHVQIFTSIKYSKRGDLQIILTSASGTSMKILEARSKDTSPFGIERWGFDSIHAWGEPAEGTWTVDIFDTTGSIRNEGIVENLTLIFHGTKEMPEHYKIKRRYNEFELPKNESQ